MPVPAGPKVVEILRMKAGEPLAYIQVVDSNIYIKYSHYISVDSCFLTYSHFVTHFTRLNL